MLLCPNCKNAYIIYWGIYRFCMLCEWNNEDYNASKNAELCNKVIPLEIEAILN